MNEHDNDDLRLVATFRDDIDEATPQRLASVRATFLKQQSMKGRTMTSRKTFFTPRRIAVIALPAVAAIALGVAALASTGGTDGTPNAGQTQTQTNMDLRAATDGVDAAGIFKLASQNTSHYGYQAADGNFIYRHVVGQDVPPGGGALADYDADSWYQIDFGLQWIKSEVLKGGSPSDDNWDLRGTDSYGAPFKSYGAGIENPTHEWLASLPTEPDALLTEMRKQAQAVAERFRDPSWIDGRVDEFVAIYSMDILDNASPIMTQEQRTNFFEMLSLTSVVTRTDGVVKDGLGREGIALGMPSANPNESTVRTELILDPTTSEILGTRLIQDGEVVRLWGFEQRVVSSPDVKS